MPSPNAGIGAAGGIPVPDPRVGGAPSAIVTGVKVRRWLRVVGVVLSEIHAVGAKTLITITTAAEIEFPDVIAGAIIIFDESGLVITAATFKDGIGAGVGIGAGEVNVFYRGFRIADCDVNMGSWSCGVKLVFDVHSLSGRT